VTTVIEGSACRDVRHTLPFLAQLRMFATVIAYPTVGVVEGFRWAPPRTDTPPDPVVLVSSAAAVLGAAAREQLRGGRLGSTAVA
jgi:hypothetical protein